MKNIILKRGLLLILFCMGVMGSSCSEEQEFQDEQQLYLESTQPKASKSRPLTGMFGG